MSVVAAIPIQNYAIVGGDVDLYTEGMSVKIYCNDQYVREFYIRQPSGAFMEPIPMCFGSVRGDLYLGGNMIESANAVVRGRTFVLHFSGVTQVPVFGAVGATIAGLGSLAVYAKKRRKSN